MRTLITISIPAEAGNAAVQNGSLGKTMAEALERLKPEAAYFLPQNGLRTSLLVVDIKDPSEIPGIAEPFFQAFNAAVTFTPVMNAEDLKKGLEKLST